MMAKVSKERLDQIQERYSARPDDYVPAVLCSEIVSMTTELQSLRNAQSEAVAFPGYAFCSQGRDGSGYRVSYGFETMVQGHAFHDAVIAAQKIASPVVAKSSCPTCNGTGDHCGNPDFGQCDDCSGTGWLHALTHPAPPLAVTDEMLAHVKTALANTGAGTHHSERLIRIILTAALEAKQ